MAQQMERKAAASFLQRACAEQDTQTKDPAEAQDRVLRQIDARTANLDGCIHAPAGHLDVERVLQAMSVQDTANEAPLEPMTAEDIECVAGIWQSAYLRAIDILEARSAQVSHVPLGREWPYELSVMVREGDGAVHTVFASWASTEERTARAARIDDNGRVICTLPAS